MAIDHKKQKTFRERTLGKQWYARAKGTHMRCSCCLFKIWDGEAYCLMNSRRMHRQCLREWLERTYETLPPQEDEIARNKQRPLTVIETEQLAKEFEKYRDDLLDRMGISRCGD